MKKNQLMGGNWEGEPSVWGGARKTERQKHQSEVTVKRGTFCSSIPARACVIPYTDYPYRMFFLTRREQMVVIFILTSLFLGAGIRHYRLERMLPSQFHPSH